jgi:hypothetical protein
MSVATESFEQTLDAFQPRVEKQLDSGIRRQVLVLRSAGIETFESCEGGEGHAFHEPTVRFHGDASEGFRALAVALRHNLKVSELRRYYSVQDGEPHGPYWEITFYR